MKKENNEINFFWIILVVVFFLFLLNLNMPFISKSSGIAGITGSQTYTPEVTCQDGDGGINPYVGSGVVTYGYNGTIATRSDTCSNNRVLETYCPTPYSNTVGITYIDCPSGCMDIACLPPSGQNCTDSDGGTNLNTQGTVSAYGITSDIAMDRCVEYTRGEMRIVETYCDVWGMGHVSFPWQCTYGCENGACLPAPPAGICTDTDGIDFYAKGTATGRDGAVLVDTCNNATYVLEAYCDSVKNVKYQIHYCPNGCNDGICMITSCVDNDNGMNYYVKGSCIDVEGTHVDHCGTVLQSTGDYSSYQFTEYECLNGKCTATEGVCPYAACLKSACSGIKEGTCLDTEGGKSYYMQGEVYTFDKDGNTTDRRMDTCNYNQVIEVSCLSSTSGAIAVEFYDCPNGCFADSCILPPGETCTDTDGGAIPDVKGTLSAYGVTPEMATDRCVNTSIYGKGKGAELAEKFCNGNIPTTIVGSCGYAMQSMPTYNPSAYYECQDGACVKVNQTQCVEGMKCKDGYNSAYQYLDCSWGSVTYCTYGCLNGACKSQLFNQTCTESDWTYSDGACQPSNTFTRTWTKIGSCQDGVQHPVTETVGCTYSVNCTSADWSYSDGPCQSNNTLTRTWTKTGSCQGGVQHPATETIICTYVPLCTDSNWAYSDALCQQNNTRVRTWTKLGNCLGGVQHPATEIVSCTYVPTCTDSDTGKNYNVKGTICLNIGTPKCNDDYCINPKYVMEYYCRSDGQAVLSSQYKCANGCLSGACKSKSTAKSTAK